MQIKTHGRSVVIDRGRVHLQRTHVLAPGLRANVSDLCAGADDEIVHATGEACYLSLYRAEMLDHRHLGQFIRDKKQMRKHRSVLAVQPMEDFNWQLDFNAA